MLAAGAVGLAPAAFSTGEVQCVLRYIVRRLLLLPILIFILSAVVFALLYWVPGDPARMMAGEYAKPETVERIRQQMGFDRPPVVQYLDYMWDFVRGDWGRSYQSNRPVLNDIAEVFPKTVQLAVAAETLSVLVGLSLGVIAAVFRNSVLDRLLMTVSVLSLSLPLFWLALILQILFAIYLGILPPSGYGSLFSPYIVLPALTLAIPSSGFLARITRAAMIDVGSADYLRTAYSKGLRRFQVVTRHMLPNAMLPIISIVSTDFTRLLAGILIIEVIFTWPGLGKYAFDALVHRDFPSLQASLAVLATSVLLVNLGADILYGIFDPRVRDQS